MNLRLLHILHVEDDDDEAECIAIGLHNEAPDELHIDRVASLAQAVLQLASKPATFYDVILLDLGLPESRGFDTIETLLRTTMTPIVVLTGTIDPGDNLAMRAASKGVLYWLPKPSSPQDILRALHMQRVYSAGCRVRTRQNASTPDSTR